MNVSLYNFSSINRDRDELLARVASLYYDQRKTQQEISDIVGVTRSAISRFLTEAREKGIVEITVNYPYRTIPDLEEALLRKFGLNEAHVLVRGEKTIDEMKQGLGVLAAQHFSSIVTPRSIIGVSWGTNLYHMIRAIKPSMMPHAEVVQLVGGTGTEVGSAIGPLLAPTLAEKLGCTCRFLNAPLITKSPEMCAALMEEPAIKQAMDRAKEADIALVGIGAVNLEIYNPYRLGYVTAEEVSRMIDCGIVGDVCVTHFSIDGAITCQDINQRVVGISYEDLVNIPTVIGVAGDISKAETIFGALKAGLVNVLVTDETAARRVLELMNKH